MTDDERRCECGHPRSRHCTIVHPDGGLPTYGSCVAENCGCPTFHAVFPGEERQTIRDADPAERLLVESLATMCVRTLMFNWETQIPPAKKVLSMNRAFMAGAANALGWLVGAVIEADPENLAGWNRLLDTALEIVRQVAVDRRDTLLQERRDGKAEAGAPLEQRPSPTGPTVKYVM